MQEIPQQRNNVTFVPESNDYSNWFLFECFTLKYNKLHHFHYLLFFWHLKPKTLINTWSRGLLALSIFLSIELSHLGSNKWAKGSSRTKNSTSLVWTMPFHKKCFAESSNFRQNGGVFSSRCFHSSSIGQPTKNGYQKVYNIAFILGNNENRLMIFKGPCSPKRLCAPCTPKKQFRLVENCHLQCVWSHTSAKCEKSEHSA